jgi:PhnB protein
MAKSPARKARAKVAPLPPIPPGFRTVTPYLTVEGGVAALEFYKKAFGAVELARTTTPDGKLVHGRLRIGDSIIMLSDAFPGARTSAPARLGSTTVTLHLYAKDVDSLWERAIRAGAVPTMPLDNQFWGERYGQLSDPFGHHWSLSMQVRMTASERKTKHEEAMASFASGESTTPPKD